jgi:hypothetical protein
MRLHDIIVILSDSEEAVENIGEEAVESHERGRGSRRGMGARPGMGRKPRERAA